ncbi:SDR family oxidoreductase [Pseudaestuariivita atlantica]|uniref:Dihydrokaempferol 4-reductase n=1 Tax=Pseudaestuariivita atlantica TaxID=1317121 RepID=A0A0L1JN72_9RHOB|nr:aldehyde reductase [Pseudaestuariivita atlantica]KNG93201.1 dihydrokaempferol 4-reductase [Pseudaestuariivita atlantica]
MARSVLLTGISGFIAKRIALDLLDAGHVVRGTLRSMSRAQEVTDALAAHVSDPASLDRLSFAEADLTQDAGWDAAMQGIDVLMHTASPFPGSMPKDENELITPAVEGTLRALKAAQASGVTRVIMTSSVVAIEANDKGAPFDENDWSDPAHPRSTAYFKSKTLAERAAWDFVAAHPDMALTAINPSLVLGSPLDQRFGTSLELIERLMSGKDPMLPCFGFGIVDVADVSAMHVKAMEREDTAGQRFIASGGSMMLPDIAKVLKDAYPDRGIKTARAPDLLVRFLALFDAQIRSILPNLGTMPEFDTSRAQSVMGMEFVPPDEAIRRSAAAVAAKTA